MDDVDLTAIRVRLAAATPGPWHTVDVRCDDAKPNEVGVCALTDPRSFQKPDGTWHGCFVARGMDGPTRDANATLIAEAPAYLAALCDEVERLRESSARLRTAVEHGESVYHEIARAAGFDHEPPSDERACIAAVKALRAERDALRAVIAGRETAPTDAEITEHYARTDGAGWWQWCSPNTFEQCLGDEVRGVCAVVAVTRWWPLDASGAPCAWPVVP